MNLNQMWTDPGGSTWKVIAYVTTMRTGSAWIIEECVTGKIEAVRGPMPMTWTLEEPENRFKKGPSF